MGRADDRKHRATGQPKGGKRPGAGKPLGTKQVLEYGEVKAIKAAGLRVPEAASPGAREVADEALATLIDGMRGELSYLEGPMQVKCAVRLREEICGPLAQKLEHSGPDGGALQVSIQINRTVTAVPPVIRRVGDRQAAFAVISEQSDSENEDLSGATNRDPHPTEVEQ